MCPASSTTPVAAGGEHRDTAVDPVAGLDTCSQLPPKPCSDSFTLRQFRLILESGSSVFPRSPSALLVFDLKRLVSHGTILPRMSVILKCTSYQDPPASVGPVVYRDVRVCTPGSSQFSRVRPVMRSKWRVLAVTRVRERLSAIAAMRRSGSASGIPSASSPARRWP